ncbi:MAG: glycosyl hydrolase family 53 [Lachnospiraceae bacterium]|nr:glycosyl hydrolase family 53 [Lachnospiraceae bacterium]
MEIKGFTYGYQATKGVYPSREAIRSREALMETGINWVCLAFSVKQKSYSSTEIYFDYRKSVPDLEIISTVDHFHRNGIKVCLKPMIDSEDGVWRALIDFPDQTMFEQDYYWKTWFEYYQAYILHYARIAEYSHCEMLCLGCEMLGTERKESYWRDLIAEVRKVYSGKLTYNTNHSREDQAGWYDALDYIGTSAYYKVAGEGGASAADMKKEWDQVADRLEKTCDRFGKPVIFMEIGCRSARGCATMPWDFMRKEFPRDEDEQANFYESCLETFSDKSWFAGIFWWDWSSVIYETKEEAAKDKGFNIHMKKAEEVLRKWWKE